MERFRSNATQACELRQSPPRQPNNSIYKQKRKTQGSTKNTTRKQQQNTKTTNTNQQTKQHKQKNILIIQGPNMNILGYRFKNTKTKIVDTRKTTPGWRLLQKYAVRVGGGKNHRFGLYDGILIKDNHIEANQNIVEIVNKAIKNKKGKKITVEVDNLSQLKKIIGLKFDRILFDNMSSKNLKKGIKLSNKLYETEASGGVTLKNVRKIASTGVKRISVGQITHSAPAANFKLEI